MKPSKIENNISFILIYMIMIHDKLGLDYNISFIPVAAKRILNTKRIRVICRHFDGQPSTFLHRATPCIRLTAASWTSRSILIRMGRPHSSGYEVMSLPSRSTIENREGPRIVTNVSVGCRENKPLPDPILHIGDDTQINSNWVPLIAGIAHV